MGLKLDLCGLTRHNGWVCFNVHEAWAKYAPASLRRLDRVNAWPLTKPPVTALWL